MRAQTSQGFRTFFFGFKVHIQIIGARLVVELAPEAGNVCVGEASDSQSVKAAHGSELGLLRGQRGSASSPSGDALAQHAPVPSRPLPCLRSLSLDRRSSVSRWWSAWLKTLHPRPAAAAASPAKHTEGSHPARVDPTG